MAERDPLLEGLRAGEDLAFVKVARLHGGLVRAVVARYFHDPVGQEEAVQDVWVHVWERRDVVDPARAAEFPGWLKTVTAHRCLDLLRRQGRSLLVPDGAPDPEALEQPAPSDGLDRQELRAAVDRFKARLRPAWRRFFELHFEQGLSYPEIHEEAGLAGWRCKYMKRVLVARARRDAALVEALGRSKEERDARQK